MGNGDGILKFYQYQREFKMKRSLPILIGLLLLFYCANCQSYSVYQELIARAGLFHLQKDYKNAISCYEKAFVIQQPDALSAYKAASVYSLNSDSDKAFYYIDLALKSGWNEADMLATDPYFDALRNEQKWKQTLEKAFATEKKYELSMKLPALRKKINLMTLNDQRLRYARIQAKTKEDRDKINHDIYLSDSSNRVHAKAILRRYGWPKISEIGKDGQNNLWLIIQHADDDVLFQQITLSAMRKLINTNEINLENYAYLYDRVQCNLNYKQLYGTQVNWLANGEASGFRSIIREDVIDERRKSMGLPPMKIYSLTYGFEYNNITALKARENDSSDLATTHAHIDSAKYFYTKIEFQKVYDHYNAASMIAGGMNNTENYEAAKLFAKIAAQDNGAQYKSISLDFLNLLYQRGGLSRKSISSRLFAVFYKEPRWIEMYNHLER